MANKKLSELEEKTVLTNTSFIHVLDPLNLAQSPNGSDFKFDATKLIPKTSILDTLESTSITGVLAANQGRQLNLIKENISNKKNTLIGNETSSSFYSTIKGIIDYFTSSRVVSILGFTPENLANKQNSLAVDGTGIKYPTVDAVNAGLSGKANINNPTFTGSVVVPTATLANQAVNKAQLDILKNVGTTGLNQGGLLTINTDTAKFNLSAGFGYVVNGHSDPNNTTHTKVTWTAKIANVIPNISTQKQTYVAVDINGDLFLTNVPLTATQRRNYIRIGVLIHLDNSAVTYIDNQPTVNIEIGGQVQDILEALGFKSLSGNRVFPVSNNLKIKKELGRVFKSGANFDNLTTQPHSFTLAAQEPITFRYRTQTGAEGSDITDITPAIYDLNGTITPVAATATLATIQRVYIFQDGVVRIQPGQRVFTTLNAAITALNSDVFVTDLDIAENGLYLGAIVLTRNTVNLSNISQAIFAPSIGTTANGSVASPALGYTAEDVANKQNTLAVDGTGAKYTTVDAVNAGLNAKISGSGTANQLTKFTASGTVGNSLITDNGVGVSIGSSNINTVFQASEVNGGFFFSGNNSTFNRFKSFGNSALTGKDLLFSAQDSGATPDLYIKNNGNVGINQPNPTEKLDVVGNGKFSGTVTASSFNGSATLTGTPIAPTATAGTNTTQIATTAYVLSNTQIKDNQIEVGTSTNVLGSWDGQTIIFTSSCTITIPATLPSSFSFNAITLAGVNLTFQITAPFTFLFGTPSVITERSYLNFTRRGITNSIIISQ
jgi:hypothetical protein